MWIWVYTKANYFYEHEVSKYADIWNWDLVKTKMFQTFIVTLD